MKVAGFSKEIQNMSMQPSSEIIIVGSGIAALSAALLLQYSGKSVVILEAHDKVGGCAGYFSAGEFTFPTGATVLTGFEIGGLHREIFNLTSVPAPITKIIDGLQVFLPDRTIFVSKDQMVWRNERRKLGGNKRNQLLFWKMQEAIAVAGWMALERKPSLPFQNLQDILRNTKLIHPCLAALALAQYASVGDILRVLNIINDRAFKALVELGLIITTQSDINKAPFLNAATGLDLWRHGAFHLIGGAGELARHMSRVFLERGGIIRFGERAVRITRDGERWDVVTTIGKFNCEILAWNGGIESLQQIADLPINQKKNIDQSIDRGGQQWGAVNLYCGVRDGLIPPDLKLHSQVLRRYDAKPGDGEDVFLSLSSPEDFGQAPSGYRALNVSTHTKLHDWDGLDARAYRAQKLEWRERLLNGVRVVLPNFDEAKKFVICATPSSWESYTHRYRGGVGGFPATKRNSNLRAISGRIAPGLWCIGDSVFPGQGTVAAALSGFNFWRDVVS